jgi:hypothetical protein
MGSLRKDPGRLSRLARAAAISATISGFVGGLILFSSYFGQDVRSWGSFTGAAQLAGMVTCIFFWLGFVPLYLFTVRKSARRLVFEGQAEREEKARIQRTKESLRGHQPPGGLKGP